MKTPALTAKWPSTAFGMTLQLLWWYQTKVQWYNHSSRLCFDTQIYTNCWQSHILGKVSNVENGSWRVLREKHGALHVGLEPLEWGKGRMEEYIQKGSSKEMEMLFIWREAKKRDIRKKEKIKHYSFCQCGWKVSLDVIRRILSCKRAEPRDVKAKWQVITFNNLQ